MPPIIQRDTLQFGDVTPGIWACATGPSWAQWKRAHPQIYKYTRHACFTSYTFQPPISNGFQVCQQEVQEAMSMGPQKV